MNEKFANVTMESDTRLLIQADTQVNGIDALYQKWIWEGITAESLIFANADVVNMSEPNLKTLVMGSAFTECDSPERMTYSQSESGFTYVNFNFETAE